MWMYGIIISSLLFQAPNVKSASWTVMVYLNGDNNLERCAIEDFNEMEAVGSSDGVNIVVQFDRASGYDYSNGDWTTCRRYLVTQDENSDSITSQMIEDIGEVDMGNYQTLADFGKWAKNNYPANRYLLVVWNHGAGWEKGDSEPVKTVSYDGSSGNEISVAKGELAQALSAIGNVDIMGFDACLMQMWEVMENVAPYANYMVGSEETEPGDGWNYTNFLQPLKINPAMDPLTLAKNIVSTTYQPTFSVVDLATIRNLTLKVDTFALELMRARGQGYEDTIKSVRWNACSFDEWSFIDLYDFARRIKSVNVPTALKGTANLVMTGVENVVKKTNNTEMNAHGISIYHPSSSTSYNSLYSKLEVAELTRWDEYLKGYKYNDSLGLYSGINDSWADVDTIVYDYGTYSFIGEPGDASFYSAVRFTPAKPCTLMGVIARLNQEFDYTLYIYSNSEYCRPGLRPGFTPDSVLYSHSDISTNGWNYIPVTPPLAIQNASDFWACIYSVNAYYPIGVDEGKHPTHRSLYSFNGKNWAEPTRYGDFYNFNIRADVKYFIPAAVEENYKPQIFNLEAYPNPFASKTVISYQLSVIGDQAITDYRLPITLSIYDISGKLIKSFPINSINSVNSIAWDAKDSPAGIYFVKLSAGNCKAIRKLILVK